MLNGPANLRFCVEATVDTPWMEPPASRNYGLRLRIVGEAAEGRHIPAARLAWMPCRAFLDAALVRRPQ
jgi:hypothetical protein